MPVAVCDMAKVVTRGIKAYASCDILGNVPSNTIAFDD